MYVCKYNVIVCMIVASQSAIKHALSSLNDICSVRLEYTYMKHIHIVITIVIGMLNKNTWGIYIIGVRPIRSNIANMQACVTKNSDIS